MNRGCKSVTMDDIAAENGISKRTLYEHFSDKSSLLEECLILSERKKKCFLDEFKNETDNILSRLLVMHDAQTDVMINLRLNFFTELKKFYPSIYDNLVKRMIKFHLDVTHSGIIKGQNQGLFRKDIDVELVSKIIIELGNTMGNEETFPFKSYGRKKLFKELLINYFRGIATQKGIDIIDEYLNKQQNGL